MDDSLKKTPEEGIGGCDEIVPEHTKRRQLSFVSTRTRETILKSPGRRPSCPKNLKNHKKVDF